MTDVKEENRGEMSDRSVEKRGCQRRLREDGTLKLNLKSEPTMRKSERGVSQVVETVVLQQEPACCAQGLDLGLVCMELHKLGARKRSVSGRGEASSYSCLDNFSTGVLLK